MNTQKEPSTYLIIGISGDGKTAFSLQVCQKLKKTVVLVGGRVSEYEHALQNTAVQEGDWTEEKNWKSETCFVFEDVQALSKDEKISLKKLVNVKSRHDNCTCILIAHAIVGSGLHPFLPLFTDIVITSNIANLRSLKLILRFLFFPQAETIEKEFASLPPFHYLLLIPRKQSFFIIDSDFKTVQSRAEQVKRKELVLSEKEKIMCFFKNMQNISKYEAVVDFLLPNLPCRCIRWSDLSLEGKTTDGRVIQISMLDYINALVDPAVMPSANIRSVHRFLAKKVVFPDVLINNKIMRRSQQ